jgi:hypothetical protein
MATLCNATQIEPLQKAILHYGENCAWIDGFKEKEKKTLHKALFLSSCKKTA